MNNHGNGNEDGYQANEGTNLVSAYEVWHLSLLLHNPVMVILKPMRVDVRHICRKMHQDQEWNCYTSSDLNP